MFNFLKLGRFKKGIITTNYPKEPFIPCEKFKGKPVLDGNLCNKNGSCAKYCPTSAITIESTGVSLDLGSCIFCGECQNVCPNHAIQLSQSFELATKTRDQLKSAMDPALKAQNISNGIKSTELLASEVNKKISKIFGRSLAIREVDAGSCNGCEVESNALSYPYYDVERLGIHIVPSPRHADMLLVTGPITRNMEQALLQAYKATPSPKLVVALGTCAISGGIFNGSYAAKNGIGDLLPVDAYIPGCPPTPRAIIYGIMVALDKIH
jgi:Ni,Fe-hydrogenase III small subunit/Pyruvate/2-oxoacid:ferredoxin oxidoreductase delta subunit